MARQVTPRAPGRTPALQCPTTSLRAAGADHASDCAITGHDRVMGCCALRGAFSFHEV